MKIHEPGATLTITFNRAITSCLEELLRHGGFGRSLEDVVDGIVRATVRELELKGFCGNVRRPPPPPSVPSPARKRIKPRADSRGRARGAR